MSEPLVSVIIPTFNRAAVIGKAIDSALNQTYGRTEIIVIDDGSTDHTSAILRDYGSRIRVLTQSNAGPAVARNRGIRIANGEVITFLDSDDYWLPAKLGEQIHSMNVAGFLVPCSVCNATIQYSDGSTKSTFEVADTVPSCREGLWLNPTQVLSSRFVLFCQVAAIRRSALEQVGYFDESLRFYEDYDLPLRLSLLGPWVVIRDPLVIYNAGTPGGWSQKALQESVRLHKDLVATRERILMRVRRDPGFADVVEVLENELRRSRRELVFSRFGNCGLPGANVMMRSLRRIERCRRALFRRGPLYPAMIVDPLN